MMKTTETMARIILPVQLHSQTQICHLRVALLLPIHCMFLFILILNAGDWIYRNDIEFTAGSSGDSLISTVSNRLNVIPTPLSSPLVVSDEPAADVPTPSNQAITVPAESLSAASDLDSDKLSDTTQAGTSTMLEVTNIVIPAAREPQVKVKAKGKGKGKAIATVVGAGFTEK